MMNIELFRIENNPQIVLGVLRIDGEWVCDTLELPWRNNIKNESCISAGYHSVKKYKSRRFGETIAIDAFNREGIIFHPGNEKKDTKGCILLGKTKSSFYLEESNRFFKKFQSRISREEKFLFYIGEIK